MDFLFYHGDARGGGDLLLLASLFNVTLLLVDALNAAAHVQILKLRQAPFERFVQLGVDLNQEGNHGFIDF